MSERIWDSSYLMSSLRSASSVEQMGDYQISIFLAPDDKNFLGFDEANLQTAVLTALEHLASAGVVPNDNKLNVGWLENADSAAISFSSGSDYIVAPLRSPNQAIVRRGREPARPTSADDIPWARFS